VEERRRSKDLENRAVSLVIKGLNNVAYLNGFTKNVSSFSSSPPPLFAGSESASGSATPEGESDVALTEGQMK
jgi:hypothetical protein